MQPQPAPWGGGQRRSTKHRRNGRSDRSGQWRQPQQTARFGSSPNVYNHPPPNTWNGQGNGQPNRRAQSEQYSNKLKTHQNLLYCYSCGYNVDHDGWNCSCPKAHHIPNVHRDQAHEYDRASMKAQHKTLPDGTGVGKGWILAQNLSKANYVMDLQRQWRQQRQPDQQPAWQPNHQQPQWHATQQWQQRHS